MPHTESPDREDEGIEPSGYRVQVHDVHGNVLIDGDAAELAVYHALRPDAGLSGLPGDVFYGAVRLRVFEDGEGR